MDAAGRLDPGRGGLRVARAGGLALVGLTLAGGAHVVGGGSLPGPMGLVALLTVLLGPAALVTARPMPASRLLAWLGGAQVGMHLTLEALAGPLPPHPGAAGAAGAAAVTAHRHGILPLPDPSGTAGTAGTGGLGTAVLGTGGLGVAGTGVDPGLLGHAGWGMLAAHAVATVLTALALARGESLLWLLRSLLPALPRRAVSLPRPIPVLAVTVTAPPRAGRRRRSTSPRGPPVAA